MQLCSKCKKLNDVIKEWQKNSIIFMGIYHTHFWNVDVDTLSENDKEYIKKIMDNMPEEIGQLYFPLVLMPKREVICYAAQIASGKLVVKKDNLIIKK